MSRPARFLWILVACALFAAACGSGGPDLRATIGKVDVITGASSPATLGVNSIDSDGVWAATGTPAVVADAISAAAKEDERSDDASGDVFLLYSSGTIWVTKSPDAADTAVVLYDDNDKAYNRHTGILILNNRWGTRVNNYRTSSAGNGFRGGGSSNGKN